MSRSTNAVEYVIILQRTGLSGGAPQPPPVQTHKPISTEICIGRQPIEHSQPIRGHPFVIIGRNPRRSVEALGTVDMGSCLQNPQRAPH